MEVSVTITHSSALTVRQHLLTLKNIKKLDRMNITEILY